MERVWKPLSVGGLRLYQVELHFVGESKIDKIMIVAAKSPSQAKRLMEQAHKSVMWVKEPVFIARPLNVFMPEEWYTGGIPCLCCDDE